MCLSRIDRYTAISLAVATASYTVGALGVFAVYKFSHMSTKLVVLALMIGQLFAIHVFFSCYRSPVVSVPRESLGVTPEDSPEREGMRRSQELTPLKTQEPGSSNS